MHPVEASCAPLRAIPPAVQRALLQIRPLSHAAAKLYALNERNADLREIGKLIGTDPSLSALVLRLVNSPLFGVRQKVTSVLQAIAMLGLDRLRALATTAAFHMMVNPATASPALTRCWRHSVACALVTQEIAVSGSFRGDTAYTAGLLHDIGCFAMLSCWPREYSNLLASCQPADQLELEFETFGVSHTDAGAFLLEKWGLPEPLVASARDHHCGASVHQSGLVNLVSRGCTMATSLGFAATAKDEEDNAPADTPDCPVSDRSTTWLRIADGINQLDWV
jgi:HD-like signal output (HDOD) protein